MATAAPEPAERSAGDASAIRVLVVDDQPLIRRGMSLILGLERDIEVVGSAADGVEAIDLARRERPDIVLMDLKMPRLGGVAATRTITAEVPGCQVVVLTTMETDDLVFDAIRAGAQAYLLKDADEAVILDTIRAVHRGESRLEPAIARRVLEEFRRSDAAASAHRAPAEPAPVSVARPAADDVALPSPGQESLSPRESEVLLLIAQGKSNKEIARQLSLAEGTVKNYVSRVMEKLHARSRTELALKVNARR